jgi:hypothetical protein
LGPAPALPSSAEQERVAVSEVEAFEQFCPVWTGLISRSALHNILSKLVINAFVSVGVAMTGTPERFSFRYFSVIEMIA